MGNEIKKDRITTDETLRETASHGSEEYPFSYYYEDIWDFDFHCIDWHWHPEVEFVYVQHGKADFLVGGNRYVLSSGDGIFINSQVIHRFGRRQRHHSEHCFFTCSACAAGQSDIQQIHQTDN